METINIHPAQTKSNAALWTGRIIGWLCTLFFLVDAVMKIIREAHHVEGSQKLGFNDSIVQPLGVVLLVITILYTIPRTAIFGALFLTAYLGGATAIMILAGQPFFFPVVFCTLAWVALYLRDQNLRALVPFKTTTR